MAITGDWQASYNSLNIGGSTAYKLMSPVEGLADHPDVVDADQPRLRADGLTAGDDFLGGRHVVLRIKVTGTSDDNLATAMATAKKAFRAGRGVVESDLSFQVPGLAGGGVRRIVGRPRKLAVQVDVQWKRRAPVLLIAFDATDPRIYDDTESTVTADLADAGTGHAWPQVWPMDWGGASTSGIVTATNDGTYSTPWTATITGPVTNPSIENVGTGDTLKFSADGGLTLTASDTLVVSSATRTALLNGTASRYSKLSSPVSWWDLDPGDTELRFGGTTSGSPSMNVTWRSAWI